MTPVPSPPVTIIIAATAAHLPVVRSAVGEIARLIGFDNQAVDAVVLAVDEALANIIQHAYQGLPGERIEARFARVAGPDGSPGLAVVLEDCGRAVQPESLCGRDLDELRPGGLGMHIMGACMDHIEYAPREGGGARLTMVKYLTRPATAPATMADQPQMSGERRG